ncbi:DUF2190 family protein [Roseobacteraceae bacterium NS-SX3]
MGPILSHISCLTFTLQLTGAVAERRFVTAAGAQAGDGEAAIGVSRNGEAAGRSVTIDAVTVVDMVAGAAIARGAEVQSDADGKPVAKAAGALTGTALTAAANPGDIVKILIK